MMDRTDRHFRRLMREITEHTLLYTEMVTTGAILRGPTDHLLRYGDREHPLALQVGGDSPDALAQCAEIAEARGFDEINLNVGCPSDRVQNGQFGACLMAKPERVAEGVAAMRRACSLPVTVKHRIGIDDLDRYEDMRRFVEIVAAAGCHRFSVHARKAWLSGLSPKENRTIPPLRYEEVYRLKAELPSLAVEINGGIRTLDEAEQHLKHVDAVMIGRAAYDHPWIFSEADARFFGVPSVVRSRHDVVRRMLSYIEEELQKGERLHRIIRPMLSLFAGQRGAKAWKRYLSENASAGDPKVVETALSKVPMAV